MLGDNVRKNFSRRKDRVAQHRPDKESKDVSRKEYAQLKSENHRLRREVARLSKYLEKLRALVDQELEFDEESTEETPVIEVKVAQCPSCSSTKLKVLNLIGRDFTVCEDCKFRKVKD